MGVATSIVVFALGAILRFATTLHSSQFEIHTVGLILMVVGAVGFVVSVVAWIAWGGFGSRYHTKVVVRKADGTVVEDRDITTS